MGIFKKRQNEKNEGEAAEIKDMQITIKILGSGCSACKKLEKNTREALQVMSLNANVEHVMDLSQIASYGAMSMPALIINEKLVTQGRVLKTKQIQVILEDYT